MNGRGRFRVIVLDGGPASDILLPPMPDSPRVTPAKAAERAAREARLAAALRDNLRRRKQQARNRAADRDAADAPAEPRDRQAGGCRRDGLSGTRLSPKSNRYDEGGRDRCKCGPMTPPGAENDGQNSDPRRRAAVGHDPDRRGQERRPAADGREPADGGEAGSDQRAGPRRHQDDGEFAGAARGRYHARRRRAGRSRACAGNVGAAHHLDDGSLRSGAQDARLGAGSGAARRALRPRPCVAAGRMRDRHAAGRSAPEGSGAARRRGHAERRLYRGARSERAARRRIRVSRASRSAPPKTC